MKKYEYISIDANMTTLVQLNEFGEDGWEICSIYNDCIYFKRELIEKPEEKEVEKKEEKEVEKKEQWLPQYGETYWCIGSGIDVFWCILDNYSIDRKRLEIKNVFKTQEEAEHAASLIRQLLKDLKK